MFAWLRRRRRPAPDAWRPEPGAAGGAADTESGADGADDPAKALAALEAMRARGLIDETEYRARRAEIEANSG